MPGDTEFSDSKVVGVPESCEPTPISSAEQSRCKLDEANGLRNTAMKAHGLAGSEIAKTQSAIAIVCVKLPNGETTYFASGSGGELRPAQREFLSEAGVPEKNILYGIKVTRGYDRLENHAERIILRNIPKGSTVESWGISWTADQKPIPCPKCEPFVAKSGGILQK